jgi:hypothetical protein
MNFNFSNDNQESFFIFSYNMCFVCSSCAQDLEIVLIQIVGKCVIDSLHRELTIFLSICVSLFGDNGNRLACFWVLSFFLRLLSAWDCLLCLRRTMIMFLNDENPFARFTNFSYQGDFYCCVFAFVAKNVFFIFWIF